MTGTPRKAHRTRGENSTSYGGGPHVVARLVCVAMLVAATGCTSLRDWIHHDFKVGPEYGRPHADVAGNWIDDEALADRTSNDEVPAWWNELGDPVLAELVQSLQYQNLSLEAAAHRIDQARSLRGAVVGNLFPQSQQAFGEYTRSNISKNSQFGDIAGAGGPSLINRFQDTWRTGFSASWELDFWGRYRRAVAQADAGLAASIRNYDAVLVLLQAELASNYVLTRAVEHRIALAEQNIKLQSDTVSLAKTRFDEGLVSELDYRQATSELASTEAIIPPLRAARREAHNRICVLLGMPPQDISGMLGKAPIPSPPARLALGIPAELLTRRPDILEAERRLAAQCEAIGIATTELYPRISITGTIALESQDFADLMDFDSMTGNIGPSFQWNVLNYGRIVNNIAIENAKFCEQLATYRRTVLEANEEVETALSKFLNELARAQALSRSVTETERAVELALIQYKEGLTDYQRVLDTQRGLVTLQDQLAESRGNVALYVIAVYKALGGGWQARLEGAGMPTPELATEPLEGDAADLVPELADPPTAVIPLEIPEVDEPAVTSASYEAQLEAVVD